MEKVLSQFLDIDLMEQTIENYIDRNPHMKGAMPKVKLLQDLMENVASVVDDSLVEWRDQLLGNLGTCECLSPISLETLNRGYCSTCSRVVTLQVRRA